MKKKNKKTKRKSDEKLKIGTLKLLWLAMSGRDRLKFFGLIILGIIASMAVLVPTQVISIIISRLSGETVMIFGWVIPDTISYVTIIVVGAIVTYIMRTINATYDLSIEKLIKKAVANLRCINYDWLVTPRKNMDLKMTQGDALYRINQAPDNITNVVVDFFSTILQDVLSAIIAIIYIIAIDIQTTPILFVGVALVIVCVVVRTKIEKNITFKTEKAKSAMSSTIANTITNLPLINLYKSMAYESKIYSGRVEKFFDEQKKQINLRWIYWQFVRLFQICTTFVIIFLCAQRIYKGTMLVGSIVIITNYCAQIFSPIQTIGYFSAKWIQCSVSVERLCELKPSPKQLLPLESKFKGEIQSIELSHVCANNGNNLRLENANVRFKKGELTVISGESGCGKSTLIKLICGLCERDSGEILVNDEKKISSTFMLVDRMSVSMQDAYIFNRDVNLNILYPDGDIPKENYAPVVEALSLGGVIKRKYDEATEHNLENMLSGGEKKRIGISRALIKKADVYIFDEPTNDLDNNNAGKVLEEIIKHKENAIVIVVTHDDRVKKVADQMLLFKERGFVERV